MELRNLMINKNINLSQTLPIFAYIIGPILSFLSLPVITSSINPTDFGTYNYYLSIISYIVLISFFPSFNSTVLRFLNRNFENYNDDKSTLIVGCFLSTTIFFTISSFLYYFIDDILFVYLCFCYFVINLFTLYKSFLNINGEKKMFAVVLLFVTLSQYSLIFILYFFKTVSLYHLLLGNLIASIFVLSYFLKPKLKALNPSKIKIKKQSINKITKFSLISLVIALSGILLATSDRILIKNLLENGDYFLGIYSVHYQLFSYLIDLLVGLFFLYIPNYLYVRYEKHGIDSYLNGLRKIIDWFIILATYLVVLVMLSHGALSHIMFDDFYLQQTKLSLYITVGQYYFGVYLVLANYFTVVNKRLIVTFLLLFFGAVNIFLNIIFIPIYGFIVAAVTTLFCYFCLFVSVLIITKIRTKKDLISKLNWVLLLFPPSVLYFLNEPKIYSSNLVAFKELLFNFVVVTILFGFLNFRRLKLLYYGRKRHF